MNSAHPPFGIGHNGPPDPGHIGRRMIWARAKAAARGPQLSPVQLRMRMARADELGLSYAQYASIRLATGRDPRAFLLSPAGLSLRLGRRLSLPGREHTKLARLRHCALMALAPEGENPEAFLHELRRETRLGFAAAAALPPTDAGWGRVRGALLPCLAGLSLPAGATVMIGPEAGPDGAWAAAIGAPFLDSAAYFAAA